MALPNLFVTRLVPDLHLRLQIRSISSVYRWSRVQVWKCIVNLMVFVWVLFTVVCPLFATCLSIDVRFLGLSGMACRSIDGRCASYFWSLVKATANGTSDCERIDEVYASGGSYSHETSIGFFIFCLDCMENIWHCDKLHQLKKQFKGFHNVIQSKNESCFYRSFPFLLLLFFHLVLLLFLIIFPNQTWSRIAGICMYTRREVLHTSY